MVASVSKEAPEFELETYYPQTKEVGRLRLKDFRGRWLILLFYPADYTFVCPTELKDIAERYDELKKLGAEVVGVSTDTVYTHKAWLEDEKLLEKVEFPMAADHTHIVSQAFGVYDEKSGVAQRGTFIIDPDGIVRVVYIVDDSIGRSSKEVLRLLKAAKFVRENEGLACPASWDEGLPTLKPSIEIVGKVHTALQKTQEK